MSHDAIEGELTTLGTFQSPQIRAVAALIANLPEHKTHLIAPDSGGGFGHAFGVRPGYDCAAVGSIMTGYSRGNARSAAAFGVPWASTTRRKATTRTTVRGWREPSASGS